MKLFQSLYHLIIEFALILYRIVQLRQQAYDYRWATPGAWEKQNQRNNQSPDPATLEDLTTAGVTTFSAYIQALHVEVGMRHCASYKCTLACAVESRAHIYSPSCLSFQLLGPLSCYLAPPDNPNSRYPVTIHPQYRHELFTN